MSGIIARNFDMPYVPPFPGAPGGGIDFSRDKGATKQADAESCDINKILKRYEKTGELPDMILRDGHYGDFASAPDYQEALNIVIHAEEQFAALDAHVRNRFNNDPHAFLEFVTDEANKAEVIKMGLCKPEVAEAWKKAEADKAEAQAKADFERRQANLAAGRPVDARPADAGGTVKPS